MNAPARRMLLALAVGALLVFGQEQLSIAHEIRATASAAQPPAAEQAPSGDETLTAVPSLISATVALGTEETTEVTLRAGVALDITVEPSGLGQSPEGGFEFVPADQDASPYSGRAYVEVTPSSFTMAAGEERSVTVTVRVPEGAGEGTRYALLQVRGQPASDDGNVGVGVALGVSVVVTLAGTTQTSIGDIEGMEAAWSPLVGELAVTSLLRNNGNAHYGAPPNAVVASATLMDATGALVGSARTTLTGNSVVPSFGRSIDLSIAPPQPLADGRYRLEQVIGLEDGTILDQAILGFEQLGGSVLGATAVPVPEAEIVPSAVESSLDSLPLILSGLLGAAAVALALFSFLIGRRVLRRRTATARPGPSDS